MEPAKRRSKVIVPVAFLVVAAGSFIAIRKNPKNEKPKYRTEIVDRGAIRMSVTATGTVSAVTTVQVGSQVSGVIARLYADFNSHVQKGQLLAELDPTTFQAQTEQRRADVTKARIETANARIMFERQKRLVAAGLAAQSELDGARAQYEGAQAQVSQASAALRQSETSLHYTKIISPIDGVVVDRQYDVGQTVAASFQAPTLFSIAQDLTKMQVQADVDQSDIGRVQVGQPSRFTVDAYPEEEFRGRIAQIRLNALVNQNVVSYPVMIEVPNPQGRLRPKMTANVTIEVARVENVIRVPNAALRFKPEAPKDDKSSSVSSSSAVPNTDRAAAGMGRGGRGMAGAAGALGGGPRKRPQTIYLLDPQDKPRAVEVKTGLSDGRFTEIVQGGVKITDKVIIGLATSKIEGAPPPGSSPGPMGGGGGSRGGRSVR